MRYYHHYLNGCIRLALAMHAIRIAPFDLKFGPNEKNCMPGRISFLLGCVKAREQKSIII